MSALIRVFIILLVFLTCSSWAEEFEDKVEITNAFEVNSQLVLLYEMAESNPKGIVEQLPFITNTESYNAAEKYILLVLQAVVFQHNQDDVKAINHLKKAHLLRTKISEEQLKQSMFSFSYLILAKSHAKLNQYKEAYDAKKTYYSRYLTFNWNAQKEATEALKVKHAIERKVHTNELLESQNKLQELRLSELKQEEKAQQLNIILLVLGIALFLVALIKHLRVKIHINSLANVDPATGLLNRQSLFDEGEKLFEVLKKSSTKEANAQLIIAVIELKGLDEVLADNGQKNYKMRLRKFAEMGKEVLRSRDLFSSLGNGKFVAVLPGFSIEETQATVERLKEKLIENDLSNINSRVFMEIGIASSKQECKGFSHLLDAAYQALSFAKSNGDNELTIFNESMVENTSFVIRTLD